MAKIAKKAYSMRIDGEILRKLRKQANDQHRSVNGLIEYYLIQATKKEK